MTGKSIWPWATLALVAAFAAFVLAAAFSTSVDIDHQNRAAALVAPAPKVYFKKGKMHVSGTVTAPAHLVLFLNGVPVFEQVVGMPAPRRGQIGFSPPAPAPECTPGVNNFDLHVPTSVPAAVLRAPASRRTMFLSAQSPCHPDWDGAFVNLSPPPNVPQRHSQNRTPSQLKPRAKAVPHLAVSVSAQACCYPTWKGGSFRLSASGKFGVSPAAPSASRVLASRVVHIWVTSSSLRYTAYITMPSNAALLQALLAGWAKKSFLFKTLDLTVDQFYRLAMLNPRIEVFEPAGSHRALVVVNGDAGAFSFVQGSDLTIQENSAPWLDYHDSASRPSDSGALNDTLAITVSGFGVSDYAVLDPNASDSLSARKPRALSPGGTAMWYGRLSRPYWYHLALSKNGPKSLTDVRIILKQLPPPLWKPSWLNSAIAVCQIAILVGLILGLFWVVRSENEPPVVASIVGILTADTCINLFARFSLAAIFSGHVVLYVVILAFAVGALLFIGRWLFGRVGIADAWKSFTFTILASCFIVVVATWLSARYLPLTASGSPAILPATLLMLRGACRVLAFALLLVQFRPDVFVSEMRPTVWRGVVLLASLVLLGACAWLVTPATPAGWLSPVGLYVPASVTADVSVFAKNLAPLLFALSILIPGLFAGQPQAWKGREWQLALFLTIMCVGNSYFFFGLPIGLAFSFIAIRFLAIRTDQMEKVDRAVAGRESEEIECKDVKAFLDIRRAGIAEATAKDAFFSGQISKEEYTKRKAAFEECGKGLRTGLGTKADYEELVLGYEFGPGRSMLENGMIGAAFGLLVGLAVTLAHLQSFLRTFSEGHMVFFDSLAAFALSVLHSVPGGFALGFMLAYLRGNTASTKGVVLALALCVGLIPYDFVQYSSQEALSESLRLVLLFGLIGLAMDAWTAVRLSRTLSLRELLGVTGFVNVTATAAIVASIVISLATDASQSLLNVALQTGAAALHSALSNNQGSPY